MLSRCSFQKELSQHDETIENRVVRRMAVLVLFQDLDEHGMAMRRTTRFSMVSSIRDDSFGSEHLLSAIYALAETARGETAVSLHQIRSTFTARRSVNVAVNGLVQTQDRGYSKLPSA